MTSARDELNFKRHAISRRSANTKLGRSLFEQPLSQYGFSLIELVVVISGISILTSISLFGIGGSGGLLRAIKSSQIDETKALLNTAAADCLQKSRLNDAGNRDTIDDEILSDLKLNTIGYKIDSDANTCSYLQLSPTDEDDDLRYPIGFSVSDGKLSKFAAPTGDASLSSCQKWAGVNCKEDDCLKELIAWKKKIRDERTKCENTYSNYIQTKTLPYISNRWNTNADSLCPSRPPKDECTSYKTSNTCTTNGCNRTVYGLDGEFVGFTKPEFDKALKEKYDGECIEWAAQKEAEEYTNDPINRPATKSPQCGGQEFWFFEGKDQETQAKFKEQLCNVWIADKANQTPPYTNNPIDKPLSTGECDDQEFWFHDGKDQETQGELKAAIDQKASNECKAEREEARSSGFTGKWGPKEGPGVCAETKYICDKKILSAYDYYKTCGKPFARCKEFLLEADQDCIDLELSDYWYKKCGPRPKDPAPMNCRFVGQGKPGNWDKTDTCGTWGNCMNFR